MQDPTCPSRMLRPLPSNASGRLALIGASLLLAGSAQADSVSVEWAEKAPKDHVYQRVLVVGVTQDENSRCEFEEFMESQLASDSTDVVQSCDTATPVVPPTRDSIAKAVAASGADAVLTAYLIQVQDQAQTGGTSDTRGGDYFKAEGEFLDPGVFGFYDVPVVYGQDVYFPPVTVMEGKVRVESKFYAAQGPQLVCTLDVLVKDVDATDVAIGKVAEAIADKLRKEKLVR